MTKARPFVPLLFLLTLSLLFLGCATMAPCPGNLMPVVEVQVNNSASNHDDYGSTATSTAARARITNVSKFGGGFNFPGGVAIELRNPQGFSTLNFSATALGAGSASMFQTLPQDGTWLNFFVRGTSSSAQDKSATIEMSTAGACNEVVVARKAMMIPSGALPIPAAPARPRVEIEIGTVSTVDDYIAWSPVFSRIRWADGTAPATLNVTLGNLAGTDRLRFAPGTLAGGSTATATSVPLTLPGDGSWVRFYVAGNFGSPSTNDKDAVFEVTNVATGDLLSREGLMVRIRKNANSLTNDERNRYLQALRKISDTYLEYIDFVRTHSRDSAGGSMVAHIQAHSGSGFLPWHRQFVLHLERVLQAADPSVALPYWKFDTSSPNMFHQDFFGANSAGNFCTLSPTNPIAAWSLPGDVAGTGIRRRTPYGDAGTPGVAAEVTTLGLGGASFLYGTFRNGMENNPHNLAHATSAFTNADGSPAAGSSWIGGSPAIAQRDPLFFSLHCNIDRLWAKWQWTHVRNDMTAVNSYDLQGSHGTPAAGVALPAFTTNPISGAITANRTFGQYADDTMWPWDNKTGALGAATTDDRPDIAILTPFPVALTYVLPLGNTVKNTIDWAQVTATSPTAGFGFGYDDFNPFP